MFITVYSKEDCPWCDKVKNLLEQRNISFSEKVLGQDFSKEDLQEILERERVTLPQVFIDGLLIGGYEDLSDELFYK